MMMFQKRMLEKYLDVGGWRKLYDEALHNLFSSLSIA
jgi:hypothetical protein